jgi:glutathionyl-hydroquinone reductase
MYVRLIFIRLTDGVYKAGFATQTEAYEANVKPLFESLDRVEKLLGGGKAFLVGDRLTEADIRLYTTIVRFDPVYHGHFKCNLGSIRVSKISRSRLRCSLTVTLWARSLNFFPSMIIRILTVG